MGMRMSFNLVEIPQLEEFVRIHQAQPFYKAMTDEKRKLFIKELKAVYKDLKNESAGTSPKDN
jgi:hypothetical protein